MPKKPTVRFTKAMRERYKAWAKKQLEEYPYERWVAGGNLNEEQLTVVRGVIENYKLIAQYGYVPKRKRKPVEPIVEPKPVEVNAVTEPKQTVLPEKPRTFGVRAIPPTAKDIEFRNLRYSFK